VGIVRSLQVIQFSLRESVLSSNFAPVVVNERQTGLWERAALGLLLYGRVLGQLSWLIAQT
jgi:hypothetical protein